MWKVVGTADTAETRELPGEIYADTYGDHLHALTEKQATANKKFSPLQPPMAATATFTPAAQVQKGLESVLSNILRGVTCEGGGLLKPNTEQAAFLRHFTSRLQLEAGEQRADKINSARGEPLLDCVHGPPGTGSSKYTSKLHGME